MKKVAFFFIVTAGVLLPVIITTPAVASWFGIGEVAKAIGDTTWRIVLINAVERLAPTILLAVVVVGAMCSFILPGYGTIAWLRMAKEAIRTGEHLDVREVVVLAVGAVLLMYVGYHLVTFGTLLVDSATAGLGELNAPVKR